jgi:C-terminal processing protease CtpA/Prc
MKKWTGIVRAAALAGVCFGGGFYVASCGSAHPEAGAEAEVGAGQLALAGEAAHGGAAALRERLPDARQHFNRVKDLLLKSYYDDKITEEDLYQAALQGMLAFVDPKMESWNRLLPPDEVAEMRLMLAGEMVGIGVMIKFEPESGIADVIGLIPGSAAEKAGILEGDKVLNVNGNLKRQGVSGLIVDLRDNQGGAFEQAVRTAGLLLQRGQGIVTVVRRGGKKEEHRAEADPVLPGVPVVVLVNGQTSSGAEFVSAALREGRRATLLGERSFGKWSVQMVEDLGGSFAVKYTASVFRTPSGQSFEGQGLTPDVPVKVDEKEAQAARRVRDLQKRVEVDAQLRTAARLLTRQ